jgi:hypothetical protein
LAHVSKFLIYIAIVCLIGHKINKKDDKGAIKMFPTRKNKIVAISVCMVNIGKMEPFNFALQKKLD